MFTYILVFVVGAFSILIPLFIVKPLMDGINKDLNLYGRLFKPVGTWLFNHSNTLVKGWIKRRRDAFYRTLRPSAQFTKLSNYYLHFIFLFFASVFLMDSLLMALHRIGETPSAPKQVLSILELNILHFSTLILAVALVLLVNIMYVAEVFRNNLLSRLERQFIALRPMLPYMEYHSLKVRLESIKGYEDYVRFEEQLKQRLDTVIADAEKEIAAIEKKKAETSVQPETDHPKLLD